MTKAAKEAGWLSSLRKEFKYERNMVKVFCDSQSALALKKGIACF